MKWTVALVLGIFLTQSPAYADTLKLKSGETKNGRILAEEDGQVLFQDTEGTVSEISSNSISILDRSDLSAKGGQVSFYTQSPRKKKKRTGSLFFKEKSPASPPSDSAPSEEAPKPGYLETVSYEFLDKKLQEWLEKHPDIKERLEKAVEKSVQESAQLNDLAAIAKQATS